MPHIVVKMYKGRTQEQKQKLSVEIKDALMRSIGCGEEHISLDIVEYAPENWTEEVYEPEIKANWDRLYIKPKY